ncbi:MAG: hypothetical protein NXI04_18305 [Planctomycetaceae bacterium]|nr:hypothetical protein [Planctomycetaceae bacterium]
MKLTSPTRLLIVLVLFCRVTAVSVQAADSPSRLTIHGAGHDLAVQFPDKFRHTEEKDGAAEITKYISDVPGEGRYLLAHQDFPEIDFSIPGGPLKATNILLRSFQERTGAELKSKKTIRVPGDPTRQGIEYVLQHSNGWFRSKSFIIGQRWYSVIIEGTEDDVRSASADRFLRSVTVTIAAQTTPPARLTSVRSQTPNDTNATTTRHRAAATTTVRQSSHCPSSRTGCHK